MADLDGILDYISVQDSVGKAVHVEEKIFSAIESLSSQPNRCRVIPELREISIRDFRELLVGPYRIPYRVEQNKVVILGVLDGRRELEELLLERALRG